MKFKCPACKEIIERDLRKKMSKYFLKKGGYRSYCDTTNKGVIAKPILQTLRIKIWKNPRCKALKP